MASCIADATSTDSIANVRVVDFENIPVDTQAEKFIYVENTSDKVLTYRVTLTYVLNNVDRVFNLSITSTPVNPGDRAQLRLVFKPTVAGQSYTDYYVVDDTGGNVYKLTVTGRCFGPRVKLDVKQITFRVCKNVSEQRQEPVNIVNKSCVDTTYQWLLPIVGQGHFQISTGICGLIRAKETITTIIYFSGTSLGIYTAELVCLVLNQEPLFLTVVATVILPGNPLFNINDHVFERYWKRKSRSTHLMENSLNRLGYVPAASVFERYLDFGMGSAKDVTLNISQTLCVTNHEQEEGYIQWLPDPDCVFIIDPVTAVIPPNESRLFTVRFRPRISEEVYGFLLCGDFQFKTYNDDQVQLKHTCFRVPCIGNTWSPCTEWSTEWDAPKEAQSHPDGEGHLGVRLRDQIRNEEIHRKTKVVMPPTVPFRTTFSNFMLANKLERPMYFKFSAPVGSNFVVMPMCGIVPGRGWQIISVALEPRSCGDYCESWEIVINRSQKSVVCLIGNAEVSHIEIMSHGYHPETHALYEFPPTITGCTNYCTAYLHNMTRMEIHIRILNYVSWLGADDCGSIVLPPKEIVRYRWWFFPKEPDKVYTTTFTCSCVCLIDGRPVGETAEIFIHITGFSEFPDLRVLPKKKNLHDIVVRDSKSCTVTLYNNGSCYFTSKLYHMIDGLEDDFSRDRLEIESPVNSLKPSSHCQVKLTVTPDGAGPRQLDIIYTVLFRTEFDEIEEIQPVTKTILIIWYDGIYPTIKIKRTISVKCPVILSNYCLWSITNVVEFNKALEDCRPNIPLHVDIFAPDLCVRSGVVEVIFVMGCVYNVPVAWSLRREKICDCPMVEVQIGISTYEMRHTCFHRPMVELSPLCGIVTPENPGLLYMTYAYTEEGANRLCYVLSMPNQRVIYLYVNMFANHINKGILTPLRRPVGITEYLAVMDCGRVPINNLDPVIRIVWLYNPTDVFTTWRLLRGNTISPDSVLRCLLYFAEVPPLGKLAIPFAFMPTEMIDYEVIFYCSFGYDTEQILVRGQGGLPNCIENRLDMPNYVEKVIRAAYRENVIYLSMEHITIPMMPTHSLSRDIIAICNDTDHIMRFIWLPERIANIVNIVMTPCWGVIHPKCTEWITMTVYTLQEPATFTTTVACEILDLTERKRYQRNELLRRNKIEKCNQEFIITEEGTFHRGINDSPPYVLDLEKPQPWYLAMTVSISSKGQRDGYTRMLLKQMWEKVPPYDLLSSDLNEPNDSRDKSSSGNNMSMVDIIRVLDGILWSALHSKMFKNQISYYSKEEIPTHSQLLEVIDQEVKPRLSRRVTSGICDAIVNKAVFHIYSLNPKHDSVMEAE